MGRHALDARVASGEEIAFCADNIKLELPEPRTVCIAPPDIIFHDVLDIDLGGLRCYVRHVGGDHATDACVVSIPDDGVLFLSDCLYDNIYAPTRHYTQAQALPLIEKLLAFGATTIVEGHNPDTLDRAQFELLTSTMRRAAALASQYEGDAAAMSAALGEGIDEDTAFFVQAFAAGYGK